MNRRAALRRLAAAALLGPGGLLQACGRRREQGVGQMEDRLSIYNWSDYIADSTIPDFEREFGVRVTYDTYESNEEMLAKLQAGASGYDLVVPTGYIVPVLADSNLLLPLRKDLLPNRKNLSPVFSAPPYDPRQRYTVPWLWAMSGLAWRRDLVPAPPHSLKVFFDGALAGKLTLLDDVREVIGAMLRYRGHSINSTDPAELAQARRDAIAAKRNLKAFVSAPVKDQLVAGDVWIAQLWNGDTAQAADQQPAIQWTLPREGAIVGTDNLVVLASAPHKRAAHAFIDYVLRPEVAARIAEATRFGSPNAAAQPLIRNPVALPTPEEMARLEWEKDLGAATEVWDRIWTEIKAA